MRTCICNVNVVDLEKGWLPFFVCVLFMYRAAFEEQNISI